MPPKTAQNSTPAASNDTLEPRFIVSREDEISRILLQLQRVQTLVQMVWGEAHSLLTTIQAVYRQRRLLIIDVSHLAAVNQSLLAAERITCDGNHQGIVFRFELGRLTSGKLQETPIFAAALPEWLYWRQQREYFRVKPPKSPPVRLHVFANSAAAGSGRYPVADLSVTGLAFVSQGELPIAEVGDRLLGCRVELPAAGTITTDLLVRNVQAIASKRQSSEQAGTVSANAELAQPKRRFRYGCRFPGLEPGEQDKLSRYLNERQRELINLGSD